ncbi:spore germination protein GerPC [Paenibacillus planticolens]|uniref:Spore germination protein GerPC n=1 Tax=Paenibacillus planticolens TaxID=2654976 RepID=A0ABX1ZIZ7_9BACL|nr:spore germination protein GerPC [Paenibacillus planticolens]NOU98821.1 hypothetical protein [Paenibacillus planticolens]
MYDANAYMHSWICRFEQRIAMLESKQYELEAENQRLKDQLDKQLKEKLNDQTANQKQTPPPNITYKIQELHVNELKGTLNIGLTSTASPEQLHSMIEKMKTDQGHTAENIFFSQDTEAPDKQV